MYTGCTNNLERRIKEHNSEKNYATENRAPFELVFYEAFISQTDAYAREKWLKTGWGRNHVQKMLFNSLKSLGG